MLINDEQDEGHTLTCIVYVFWPRKQLGLGILRPTFLGLGWIMIEHVTNRDQVHALLIAIEGVTDGVTIESITDTLLTVFCLKTQWRSIHPGGSPSILGQRDPRGPFIQGVQPSSKTGPEINLVLMC